MPTLHSLELLDDRYARDTIASLAMRFGCQNRLTVSHAILCKESRCNRTICSIIWHTVWGMQQAQAQAQAHVQAPHWAILLAVSASVQGCSQIVAFDNTPLTCCF